MVDSYPDFYEHVQANMGKYSKESRDTRTGFIRLHKTCWTV
jgi:hypothetical protein